MKTTKKSDALVRLIRSRVVGGKMKPGTRLPNRIELFKELDVSPQTLQRALDRLVMDGFVIPRGRAGTFVADRPPHLHRVAMIFPDSIGIGRNRFFRALQMAAEGVAAEADRTLLTFEGIDGHTESREFARLAEDVVRHRIAGMIFATNPSELRGTPVLDEPDIPRVAFAATGMNDIPTVFPDFRQLISRAVRRIAQQGGRRLGVLTHHQISPTDLEQMLGDLSSFGITTRREWQMGMAIDAPEWVHSGVRLLMSRPLLDRPDALLILDDHLTEPIMASLAEMKMLDPKDLIIVSHNNFPLPLAAEYPIIRIGFDARTMVRKCFDLITAQRTSDKVFGESLMIPAIFEEEL